MPNDPVTTPTGNTAGGDMDLEALLAALDVEEGGSPSTQPAPVTTSSTSDGSASQTQSAPAVTTTTDGFFLQAPTGSVYKTREEAEKGFAQKDALIEDLRNKYIAITHTDPISGKMIAPVTAPIEPINYARDSDKFYDALSESVNKSDKVQYANVMKQFVSDLLQPYMPSVTESATNHARAAVAQELPDFNEVVTGDVRERALNSFPGLKQAIQAAETNPDYFAQLPELYKLEYLAAKTLRSAGAQVKPSVPVQTTTTPSARPTVSGTTLTPTASTAVPNLATAEGRRAIIEQAEGKGIDKLIFGNLRI